MAVYLNLINLQGIFSYLFHLFFLHFETKYPKLYDDLFCAVPECAWNGSLCFDLIIDKEYFHRETTL
jgi:hypothetical protein